MDIIKCDECGWVGDMNESGAHFYGKVEIPLCPACDSEKISDIETEDSFLMKFVIDSKKI